MLLHLFAIVIAGNLLASAPNTPRYNLSVCALFTNEAKYLKEWIEYHQLIGVDHFYLYDNNSKDRFRSTLSPYIKKGIVTLISWPDFFEKRTEEIEPLWALSTMASAYEHAIHYRSLGETKWLTILNINEFLVPLNTDNIPQILEKYDSYPGIVLQMHYYDSSKIDRLKKNKLIIESSSFTHEPKEIPFKRVEKAIFKPDQCTAFSWPPIRYKFKDNQEPKTLNGLEARVNEYRNRGYSTFQINKHKLFIDHRTIAEEELKQILDQGYEVEDQEKEIHRFLPELKKKLGFGSDLN